MNTKDFIEQANQLHGGAFDYSKTNYTNNHSKVEIICSQHGSFFQAARSHLKGFGCKKCSYGTTGKFVRKAQQIHGTHYDYSITDYKHSLEKVKILCPVHGIFEQTASNHLRGSGCSSCGLERANDKRLSNTSKWIEKAKTVHGDLFDYSLSNYTKASDKIVIVCLEHGPFEQKAHSHLEGYGCPFCQGVIRTTQRFIERASLKQPKDSFTYEHTHYVNSTTPIIVTCSQHGPFSTSPSDHIRGGNGCPRCQGSSPENKWLDSLHIADRQVRIDLDEGYVRVDGYDPLTKTIYEFHGDFWHGNPNIYQAEEINQVRNISFGDLYKLTIDREQRLRDAGYTVIVMWERDWKNINDM